MDAQRKTLIRLSEDARDGFGRVAAKGNFNNKGQGGNAPPQFGGEEGGGQPFQKGGGGFGQQQPGNAKRQIPDDHDFDKKAIKPIVKSLWAMSVALGHALTAHRQFSRLKSSTFSPDGLLGGRGYVMPVKEIRSQLFEACENLSALVDTLHDEINAPHWKAKLGDLEKTDMAEVERLLTDAEEWVDNPEEAAEEEEKGVSSEGAKWTKEKHKDDDKHPRSDVPGGGDKETLQKSGPNPGSPDHPQNKSMKQAASGSYDRRTAEITPGTVWTPEDRDGAKDPQARAGELASGLYAEMPLEDLKLANLAPEMRALYARLYKRGNVTACVNCSASTGYDKCGDLLCAECRQPFFDKVPVMGNSSVDPGTLPGPRVDHLDRADVDQTGPGGSYNRDEKPVSDEWGEEDGVSGEPMSQDTGDSYAYPSDYNGDTSAKWAVKWGGDVYNPHAVLPNDPDRALGDRAKGDHTTTIEDEEREKDDAQWKAAFEVWGSSGVPDSNSDSTPTEGFDFGIGDGNGNDAHGQGAGGYGESNPSAPDSNPDSGVGNMGVYGPQAELPNDPGGSTKDRENSDTVPKIERGIGNNSVPAVTAAGELPNDDDGPVARSDYYWGDKGNDFNYDKNRAAAPTEQAQSRTPGNESRQPPAPMKARPEHLGEWEFAAGDPNATSGMPGDNPGGTYESDPGYGVDEYHRVEQVDQPYVTYDDNTHNMTPDDTYQNEDLPSPYVNQTTP